MSSTDEHTLARLFSRSMSHNPHWRDIVHMFESLGAGCDGTKKDHLTVKPNSHEMSFPIQYTGVSTPRDNPRDCRDPPIAEAVRLSPGRCALSRPITRSLKPGGGSHSPPACLGSWAKPPLPNQDRGRSTPKLRIPSNFAELWRVLYGMVHRTQPASGRLSFKHRVESGPLVRGRRSVM